MGEEEKGEEMEEKKSKEEDRKDCISTATPHYTVTFGK
jgi:hypothetical protein